MARKTYTTPEQEAREELAIEATYGEDSGDWLARYFKAEANDNSLAADVFMDELNDALINNSNDIIGIVFKERYRAFIAANLDDEQVWDRMRKNRLADEEYAADERYAALRDEVEA
ncbi:MAG: hypothetical protein CMK46_07100 [Porticoccus sp.]|uniref:hypothetical protein n=1 Tax=Pseudomonadota TaxID=1224 RepID=UPI000C452FB1|nr:hypothetical protein [Rhodospirillaceae bacterium]MBG57975.1 hypothetical protein [Porticoccus sp.]MAX61582.1 hypothetical protein [Rhodospirillaceae bacterium]MAX61647.1 hypothetical protein [Rhodospirillaceae bacterium]MAX61712.1 hypothetical protein [Rhodospirillaceae bacterium]